MQQFRGSRRIRQALMASALTALSACGRGAPEQAVREQVGAMQAAIDARDVGDLGELLADDFVGNDGMARRAAKQLAAAVFLRHRDVGAKVGPVSVEHEAG